MRFKVDENLPPEVVARLRAAGHDATGVLEQRLGGESDPRICAVCRAEERALVTLDLDFADIRAHPPAEYPGLVVLRLKRQNKARVLSALAAALKLLESELPERMLWIVEEGRIRICGEAPDQGSAE